MAVFSDFLTDHFVIVHNYNRKMSVTKINLETTKVFSFLYIMKYARITSFLHT